MKAPRVLVAGGAGFLGANLCRKLVPVASHVYCVDNLQTGSRANIEGLLGDEKFTFIQHDISVPLDINFKIDRIFNLASPASPPKYQLDPVKTSLINVLGTYHLLELARAQQARFLQASTSEVYGDPEMHPQTESYRGNVNPIGPRSCYDEGKRMAESLSYDFKRQYDVDVRIARIFNTYGPGMDPEDGRVVSNFIVQALREESLTMYGDGKQTRSFCFVDDLVGGLMSLMDHEASIDQPVNLGNPEEFSVSDLAAKVIRLSDSRSRILNLPLPVDDPKIRKPDIQRARVLLNWEPKVGLEEGLARTIEYFSNKLSEANVR